jgi:hypothetical protein
MHRERGLCDLVPIIRRIDFARETIPRIIHVLFAEFTFKSYADWLIQ